MNLLRRNKHPHPLIYMRGLKSEDLVAMIDYLYFGEVNIFQENLNSFLAVAEDFQLNGLMGSGDEEDKIKEDFKNSVKKGNTKTSQIKQLYHTRNKNSKWIL